MVKSDTYILSEGIHDALIDDETWRKAQAKRKSQAKKYEKINKGKDEKSYLLSSIVRCPICGAGLYGNKSRKKNKNKDGEHYKDYYYYACKHRKLMDGHKCNFSKQIRIELLDREVLAIISQIVSNPTFANRIEKKINIQTDTKEIDKVIEKYESKFRQLNATKINLINQIDTLDFEDRNYDSKYKDLNLRLDNTYDQIADIEDLIQENENKRELILKDKMTSDNVYKILVNFDTLLSVMKDVDKKRLCSLLIEEIQLYEEKQKNGQWIKTLSFKLPIIEEDMNISLDNDKHVETVALIVRD